ncbi:MAG TPA: hypothetical protein VHY84_17390 [Bryobacteraceae bacterium]|nr:hypothetical protein [Bryobacteraceae bacterium]
MERTVGQKILERKIGEGGMAEVWQGRHVHPGNIAAVEFLLPYSRYSSPMLHRTT